MISVGARVAGGALACCCAVGGGVYVYDQSQGPSTPTSTTTPSTTAQVTFDPVPSDAEPPPTDATWHIKATGPLAAQVLPSAPGYWTISGSLATNYLSRQVSKYPELQGQVGIALTGLQCLESTGYVAGNAYVKQDLAQAGVVASLTIPPNVDAVGVLKCVAKVIAGGPVEHADQWRPCYEAFEVDVPLSDGSGFQRFYMFTAGTSQDWCVGVDQLYGQYGKQALG